jgi:hypothetical protein
MSGIHRREICGQNRLDGDVRSPNASSRLSVTTEPRESGMPPGKRQASRGCRGRLVVRLSTHDRLCAHITNLRVQTRIHYPMAFIKNLHRETGDGFRRECETPRLTDSFPESNRVAASADEVILTLVSEMWHLLE